MKTALRGLHRDKPTSSNQSPVATILSTAAVVITSIAGAVAIWITNDQKNKELDIAVAKNASDVEVQKLKTKSDIRTARGELIGKNIERLVKDDPYAKAIVVWTLEKDEAKKFFSIVERYGPPEARPRAKEARIDLEGQQLKSEQSRRLWIGKWDYSFQTREGAVKGYLILREGASGTVTGEFSVGSKESLINPRFSRSDRCWPC